MLTGSEEPRVFTPPARPLTPETSAGFSIIEFATFVLGVDLYPWQRWFLIHAFELNPDGTFRFRTVLLLVGRQNGKTTLDQVIALWFMFVRRAALVLGTAQTLDVSEETWEGALAMAQASPETASIVSRVVRVNGKKEFRAGPSRYKVAAASRKGGRGQTANLVILDELREHTTWDSWSAVTKTTLAMRDALVLATSNAGDATSVVLRHLRAQAMAALGDPDGWARSVPTGELDAENGSIGLFEWSAEPNCGVADRAAWRASNPSLGHGGITERALADSCATDPEAEFRTECLCQWVETMAKEPFPEGAWAACLDAASEIAADSPLFFGVDVSADRSYTTIAVCGARPDGQWHIEVAERRAGTAWAVKWFSERGKARRMRVAYQGRGAPASDLGEIIAREQGVDAVPCEGRSLSAWCGRLWDAVAASAPESTSDAAKAFHLDQPVLDLAAKCAAVKPLGDGAWCFDRVKSPEDIAPLMACAMAFGLATEEPEPERVSAYEEHGMRTV